MNPAQIFITRPVMTTLVMIGILIFGLMGYRYLPVSALPNVDFPTIQVTATMAGASPETMAASIATPLEKEFTTIAGLDSMTSTSGLGMTRITLQFSLTRNIDAAAQDVQSAIGVASRKLPPDMTDPPSFRKVNPADDPILYLGVGSEAMRLSDTNEYADSLLGQRISMIPGVAQVLIYGSQKYAVRIQLDPDALASREIGLDEVEAAVKNANVNLATGVVTGPRREYTVQATGQLMRAKEYLPLIVVYRNGSPVRLSEVGTAFDSVEENRRRNWINGAPGMVVAVQRQPGANTVAVVDAIKAILPQLKEHMPASLTVETMIDRSESIRASVEDVQFTLVLTVALVVLVIFLFLRNVRATLIPSLALPMSVIGTFALMHYYNFSLDNISLMALTLSVGFVVDDAIVMLENIVRHMEHGKGPLEAALEGSREISFTIVSMTISLAAVFIPVLFMGGIVGRLFKEFAVTIMASILISGFVSISLTPMLCAKLLRHHDAHASHGRMYMFLERLFESLLRLYDSTLKFTLRHSFSTLMVSFGLLALTVWMFMVIPKGFIPSEDVGIINCVTEAEQGIAFENMVAHQNEIVKVIRSDPNVESLMSVVGAGGPNPAGNSGRMVIRLKPREERELSADQIIARLRPKLAQVTGIQAFLVNPPPIRIGGMMTKGLYQFTLQSPNTADLYQYVPELEQKMRELKEVVDVNSDLQIKNPQVNLEIDRDKATALGISARQIESALGVAYSSKEVSTIYAPNNDYKVIMELGPNYQRDPALMSRVYVRASSGKLVPLEALTKRSLGVGPMTVNHSGQMPSATISFNLRPGVSLGQAVDAVQDLAIKTLPASVSRSFSGTAQAFQDSMKGIALLLVMSLVVIYIVLGVLYESYIHPLTILSGLPSAAVGALATLSLFKLDLDLYGFVGIIMLIGIVKKNAIMMIDFALEAQRNDGLPAAEAIYQGCLVRFRPIMMTTMAALMGTLPIAAGVGAGAEARRPLGLAVVGGLMVSQLLTLYFTPVYYIYLDNIQKWIKQRSRRGKGRGVASTASQGA